jgi:hypothetical protein
VVEVTTTYTEEHVQQIKVAQSADVLYIVHPSYAPAKLERTSHTAWTLTDIQFQPPPTAERDWEPNTTITPAATTGAGITFTAGASIFLSGDVGRQIISGSQKAIIVTYTSATQVDCDIIYDFDDTNPIASGEWLIRGSPNAEIDPTADEPVNTIITLQNATADVFRSTDVGKYVRIRGGLVKITVFTNATTVKGEILAVLNEGHAPTDVWIIEESLWTATLGYPGAVALFEQRLCLAGSTEYPQTVWGSVSAAYENFALGSNDDDAFEFSFAANQVNIIKWLEAAKVLFCGTTGGEWRLGATTLNDPLTPSNVNLVRETSYGTADIQPVSSNHVILFVQRLARKIREISYNFDIDGFIANDLTILSDHLPKDGDGIKSVFYQPEPNSIIWAVRNDGVLLGLTYHRDHEVIGWHRHVLGGTDVEVESGAVIPSADEAEYEVWLSVKRTVNSSTVRYIERIKPIFDGDVLEDAFFVDSGMTYDGAAATSISGLSHLEGESVAVLADGVVISGHTVASGAITLASAASKVHVGLTFTPIIETMRFEGGSGEGTAQGKSKRIHRVTARLHESVKFQIGPDSSHTDEIDETVLTTDDVTVDFPGGYDEDSPIYITLDEPLPLTILSLAVGMSVFDG